MTSLKRKIVPDIVRTKQKRRKTTPELVHSPESVGTAKRQGPTHQDGNAANPSKKPTAALSPLEPAPFPRGGASLLTPVERKQIQAQATRDTLFESGIQDIGSLSRGSENDIDETGDQRGEIIGKKDSKTKSKRKRFQELDMGNRPKIESFKFKHIVSGTILLGQVVHVTMRDLALALPNGLTGHVPLTAISRQITEDVESILLRHDVHMDEDSEVDAGDIDIRQYFLKGQYLRSCVTSASDSSQELEPGSKKRIELSVEPTLCNAGMDHSSLVLNNTVQASITSVEDHGLVMDLGLENNQIQGFLSFKEMDRDGLPTQFRPGMVFLCLIIGPISNGRTVKLSVRGKKISLVEQSFLRTAPSVNSILPGTAVEILLSDVTEGGLAGQLMGMLDVTSDIIHSGMRDMVNGDLRVKEPGARIRARLIFTLPSAERRKLGFSLLPHILKFEHTKPAESLEDDRPKPSDIYPDFLILRAEPGFGVFAKIGKSTATAFVHLSRLSDSKIDSIAPYNGPYKVGSTHRGRILGYDAMDNLFTASFQDAVINQPFLRIEDVKTGQKVKGIIEKATIRDGDVTGLLISLADGVSGLVPRIHMSDVQLQQPEKRFKIGSSISARVVSTDPTKRQIRLTLKKSLVNSDAEIWRDLAMIKPGSMSPGALVKVDRHGAVVQFFGNIKGFLPVSEMSEAYIKDATQHFREGQVINVTATEVDPEKKRLILTCKDPEFTDKARRKALKDLRIGSLVSGKVFEKTEDDLLLRLEGSDLIARLELVHISDGSLPKRDSAFNKIRVGQILQDVLVLDVLVKRGLVKLCNRTSLKAAANDGQLPSSLGDIREGMDVKGFITNITEAGVFVGFAAGMTGLLSRSLLPPELSSLPDYGMSRFQVISARVHSVKQDETETRFWLTTRPLQRTISSTEKDHSNANAIPTLVDPVDGRSASINDFVAGYQTKAQIISVKESQINVILAKDVQGRIHVSDLFDDWKAIKDKKRPLRRFQNKQILPVRILGLHDARNHRFLPISHRSGKASVFEVSAKPSLIEASELEKVTLDKIQVGSSWTAFVNNVTEDWVWVNITPNIRGRVRIIDLADDVLLLRDVAAHFPIGCALQVHVTAVDLGTGYLDLSAKTKGSSSSIAWNDLSKGLIVPGRVTRSGERQILVQLNEKIVGAVDLVDMADDFSKADPTKLQKNDIVRVCVLDVDAPNKKVSLSTRPSKVMSSSLSVIDPEITGLDQVEVNGIYRGFISSVVENGIFVVLGHAVTAFVRVTNLSDSFLKDWKSHYQRDQLVRGRVIAKDHASKRLQMSLKQSVLKQDYKPPMTLDDLSIGQIVAGKVAKVEDFGVFIVVDESSNVRGLCHRSELSDRPVEDVRRIYSENDAVKAKVLKIELERRRINFGLKASYFAKSSLVEPNSDQGPVDMSISGGAGFLDASEADEDTLDKTSAAGRLDRVDKSTHRQGEDLSGTIQNSSSTDDHRGESSDDTNSNDHDDQGLPLRMNGNGPIQHTDGLSTGGFNWSGAAIEDGQRSKDDSDSDSEDHGQGQGQNRLRGDEVQIDRTGDLDAHGPQSADDYERLLLGKPDSSLLWLQYMALQLELGEIDIARQIARRALDTIGIGQDEEKRNVQVALLNLENTYGDDDSILDTFGRACQLHDPKDIHGRLGSIYIQSGKHDVCCSRHVSSSNDTDFL